jgi:aminoglycoside/choline kinase family phosphotransferase
LTSDSSSPINNRIETAVVGWSGESPVSLEPLVGDASARTYVRITGQNLPESPAMAMLMPPGAASEEAGGGGPAGRLPFIEMAEWFTGRGVRVPRIYHYAESVDVLLHEDLGSRTLERALATIPREELYERAVDLLVDFQQRTTDPEPNLVACSRAMDRSVLKWELEHYVQWRLEADLGHGPGAWKASLSALFEGLLDALDALPTRLIHRDFQSRNLMLSSDDELILIDFQDAMIGPFIYDLVALLRDSYVVLDEGELGRLVGRYAARARDAGLTDADESAVRQAFHLQTVQRKLKDTGRFVFIDRVKGNPAFLQFRDPSMTYVREALASMTGFNDLESLLAELDPQ